MIVKTILACARERLAVIEVYSTVKEAAALLSKPHLSLVVVCEHGKMVGVLTKTDIVGQIESCLGTGCIARVDSIMTRDVAYCQTHESLRDVWSIMKKRGLQRIPIIDETGRPLGIIYARDALQTLLSEAQDEDKLLHDYISGDGYW